MSESQKQNSRAAVHARIIEVAGQQFQKKGIRSVHMDDLANLLGISKRTLYEEFEDKEAVLKACLEEAKKQMESHLIQFREESDNVLSVLLKMFRMNMNFLANTNPKYFEDLCRYPDLQDDFHKGKKEHDEHMRIFLEKGMEQGMFKADLNVDMYLQLQDLMQEVNIVQKLRDRGFEIVDIFHNTLLISLRGISTPKGIAEIDAFFEK